jgi:hypothetical protein
VNFVAVFVLTWVGMLVLGLIALPLIYAVYWLFYGPLIAAGALMTWICKPRRARPPAAKQQEADVWMDRFNAWMDRHLALRRPLP